LQRQRSAIRRGLARVTALALALLAVVLVLAVVAVVAVRRAERSEQVQQEQWWDALQTQARASRSGGGHGARRESLDALTKAAAMRLTREIRDEAVAALALPDLVPEQRTWPLPSGQVAHALDDLGEHLAVGFTNGTIEVRSWAGSDSLARLSPGPARPDGSPIPPEYLYFQPGGALLAAVYSTPAADDEVRLWDWRSGQAVRVESVKLNVHSPALLEFRTDGRFLVFASEDMALLLLDLAGGEPGRRRNCGRRIYGLSLHPHEPWIAISLGKELELWNWLTGEVRQLSFPSFARCLVWSAQGDRLAVGCDTGEVHLWERDTGRRSILAGHSDWVRSLSFHPSGEWLITSSVDGSSKLWNVPEGQAVITVPGARAIGFSRDGRRVAFTQPGGTLGNWRFTGGEVLRSFTTRDDTFGYVRGLDLSRNGSWMATLTGEGMQLWNLERAAAPAFLPLRDAYSVWFAPGSTSVVTTAYRGIESWSFAASVNTGQAQLGGTNRAPVPQDQRYSHAGLRHDGQRLIVTATGFQSLILELPGLEVRQVLKGSRGFCVTDLSADGKWAASAKRFDDEIVVWELAGGEIAHRFTDAQASVAFSPDNRWLVVGTAASYRFHRLGTWEVEREISRAGTPGVPPPVAFSHDGRLVALCRDAATPELVDGETGEPWLRLTAPRSRNVRLLRFSPDDRWLAAGTGGGAVQVWDLQALRAEMKKFGLDWDGLRFAGAGSFPETLRPSPYSTVWIAVMGVGFAALLALVAVERHRRLLHRYVETDALAARQAGRLAQAEREALHGQKMRALGALAAGIAHDFNNLLSIIRMSNRLIAREGKESPEIQDNSAEIEQAVEQGKNVVRSMLGYSRHPSEDGVPYSAAELVENVVALLGRQFLSGITLTLELAPDAPQVTVPRARLEQILLNLVVNASEAMNGQGKLFIGLRRAALDRVMSLAPRPASGFLALTVADSGAGIPDDVLPRIFEPFFTTKTVGAERGAGLGLSLVYQTAREEGLGIAVETAPGRGTTFHILIPVDDAPRMPEKSVRP
jgi:signal transduction histidine kinase